MLACAPASTPLRNRARRLSFASMLVMLSLLPVAATLAAARAPHIVLIAADDEYRSEESLPMLGRILEQRYGFRVSLRFAVDPVTGLVSPPQQDNVPGLDALDDADLMIVYARFRRLPQQQLAPLLRYVESGKPIVGFRTSTHLFRYPQSAADAKPDGLAEQFNAQWPRKVFGQQWLVHHGHFSDGDIPLTDVSILSGQETHPILRGVKPFQAMSWLYHIEGDGDQLAGNDNTRLLWGVALKSRVGEYLVPGYKERYAGRHFPWTSPVAWTHLYETGSGKKARVFFTTLGHPYDFKEASMRKLALNGIFWALGKESDIPQDGLNVDFVGAYEPLNSGVGTFRAGMEPAHWRDKK